LAEAALDRAKAAEIDAVAARLPEAITAARSKP
jgi:hypothetical protein